MVDKRFDGTRFVIPGEDPDIIRVRPIDLVDIVRINNQSSKWVGKKTKEFFSRYLHLEYFDVAFTYTPEDPVVMAGFIMVMDQNTDYDSPNFAWFKERLDNFFYIDRIVIAKEFQRERWGRRLYDRVIKTRGDTPIVCEVSVKPEENTPSIRFHEKLGFVPMGEFYSQGKQQIAYILR